MARIRSTARRARVTELVLCMAGENTSWGYDRIQGALANLGHMIAPNTVKNILKRHGIEPAPERGKRASWKKFLKAHWDVMATADFVTVEVWTVRSLATCYPLFAMRLKTRCVHIAGITTALNGAYMQQVARNLTDVSDGFLVDSRHLIMGRDTKYMEAFRLYFAMCSQWPQLAFGIPPEIYRGDRR